MGKKLCPECGHDELAHVLIYHTQKYYCDEIGCSCGISRKELYPNDGKYYWPICTVLITLLGLYLIKNILGRI